MSCAAIEGIVIERFETGPVLPINEIYSSSVEMLTRTFEAGSLPMLINCGVAFITFEYSGKLLGRLFTVQN